ncbi:ATP-binding cassette domain-containing protein, partial [Acidimicrobiaceae bacterium USS-CC1]|nr:ATP-binding cassette domain-containing protein [Acidiferrimicrobium australe]
MGEAAVALQGVEKWFGHVHAVAGIDLEIAPGEVVAFLGPNGAGKTTTIDLILGLQAPSAGSARVFGLDPRQAVRRGLVAAVMQNGGLLRDLTVAEIVEYTAHLFSTTRPVDEVMRRAGITDIAGRMV